MGRVFRYVFRGQSTIRVIVGSAQPVLVFRDVCAALGIKQTALTFAALKDDERETRVAYDEDERQRFLCLNIRGINSVLGMNPDVMFERWFRYTLLPQLRELHRFEQEKKLPRDYVEALEALLVTERELVRLQNQVEQSSPIKVEHHNVENALTMNQVAKTLRYGRNRLFVLLREQGFLLKDNTPYQRYLEQGLFVVRAITIEGKSGRIPRTQTLVTPKGMQRIRQLLEQQQQHSIAQ
ncbi:phage antirepressor KilAC domain-containing protein [Alicyclobacillus fodiniaquatilis]|uniref:Phage antirepressor KilAC domain-containing protein n=1 Tax=Alicyclobacillus fodiniaquatilis TaxID=1661150 RepID=A0ABW4JI94_9BACL